MKNFIAFVGCCLILLCISVFIPYELNGTSSVSISPNITIGEMSVNDPEDIAEYLMEKQNANQTQLPVKQVL